MVGDPIRPRSQKADPTQPGCLGGRASQIGVQRTHERFRLQYQQIMHLVMIRRNHEQDARELVDALNTAEASDTHRGHYRAYDLRAIWL